MYFRACAWPNRCPVFRTEQLLPEVRYTIPGLGQSIRGRYTDNAPLDAQFHQPYGKHPPTGFVNDVSVFGLSIGSDKVEGNTQAFF